MWIYKNCILTAVAKNTPNNVLVNSDGKISCLQVSEENYTSIFHKLETKNK